MRSVRSVELANLSELSFGVSHRFILQLGLRTDNVCLSQLEWGSSRLLSGTSLRVIQLILRLVTLYDPSPHRLTSPHRKPATVNYSSGHRTAFCSLGFTQTAFSRGQEFLSVLNCFDRIRDLNCRLLEHFPSDLEIITLCEGHFGSGPHWNCRV